MSISALEDFLVKDLSEQLGEAMSEDVVETIENGMAAENKIESAEATQYTYSEGQTPYESWFDEVYVPEFTAVNSASVQASSASSQTKATK